MREVGSLEAGMQRTGLGAGTIVTLRKEGAIASEYGTANAIPAWKWMLLG